VHDALFIHGTLHEFASSLQRGHANLFCIVPILVYVPSKRVLLKHEIKMFISKSRLD